MNQNTIRGFKYSPSTGNIYRNFSLSKGKVGPIRRMGGGGYYVVGHLGKAILCHRLAYHIMSVLIPNGKEIDHINGIKTDNRWVNLRIVDKSENARNKEMHRKGKLPGCSWHKLNNKFIASAKIGGIAHHLGYFKTEIEAHNAYMEFRHKMRVQSSDL